LTLYNYIKRKQLKKNNYVYIRMAVKIETTMNPYKQVMIFETVKDYIEYLRELEMLNTIVEQVVEEPVIENIVEPVIENIEPIELVIENVIEEEPIEILTKPNVITYDMGIEALKEKYEKKYFEVIP
jgi:hypothetical protein